MSEPVLFALGVLERRERFGCFPCLEKLSSTPSCLSEPDSEFQVRSLLVAIRSDCNLWPSAAADDDLRLLMGVAWCLAFSWFGGFMVVLSLIIPRYHFVTVNNEYFRVFLRLCVVE